MSDISICQGRRPGLTTEELRAGWEAERGSIREFLLKRKFNPKHVDKVVNNMIESFVFAGLPCTTLKAVGAACEVFAAARGVSLDEKP